MSRKPKSWGSFGEIKEAFATRTNDAQDLAVSPPTPEDARQATPAVAEPTGELTLGPPQVTTHSGKVVQVTKGKTGWRPFSPPPRPKAKTPPANRPTNGAGGPVSSGRKKGAIEIKSVIATRATPPEVARTPTLQELSADVSRLVIRLPESDGGKKSDSKQTSGLQKILSKVFRTPVQKFAASAPSPAIIGFDFGTAFTKVVVQWRDRHFPVEWRASAPCADRYLLPSCFSQNAVGEAALGRSTSGGWTATDSIKLRLIEEGLSTATTYPPAVIDAVVFMALALRHSIAWFHDVAEKQRGSISTWRLNVGLPAQPWEDEPLRGLLAHIAKCAFQLAEAAAPVTRSAACETLNRASEGKAVAVSVVAEFAAQLASYMRSPQRENDIHGLIDIGAGTVDFVSFNAHKAADTSVLPIASSAVEKLGTHYLLGALVGRRGQDLEWADSDAAESDALFSKKNSERPNDVAARRQAFVSSFKRCLNTLGSESYNWYPRSERFRSDPKRLPVFLCGGGTNIPQYREILSTWRGLRVEVRTLPMPEGVEGEIAPDQFHRLSVAYGLSLLQRNLAEVWRKDATTVLQKPREIYFGDRDADR